MVLLLCLMDRASTPSLTAKRAEVRLMSPYWKSTWWVVVGDLLGLLVPPVLQAPSAQPEPQAPQEQQAQPEQRDRPDPPGQQVRPEQPARQALQVPPVRLEQPVSPVPRVQLEPQESRVIREPLAPPDRLGQPELPELPERQVLLEPRV